MLMVGRDMPMTSANGQKQPLNKSKAHENAPLLTTNDDVFSIVDDDSSLIATLPLFA